MGKAKTTVQFRELSRHLDCFPLLIKFVCVCVYVCVCVCVCVFILSNARKGRHTRQLARALAGAYVRHRQLCDSVRQTPERPCEAQTPELRCEAQTPEPRCEAQTPEPRCEAQTPERRCEALTVVRCRERLTRMLALLRTRLLKAGADANAQDSTGLGRAALHHVAGSGQVCASPREAHTSHLLVYLEMRFAALLERWRESCAAASFLPCACRGRQSIYKRIYQSAVRGTRAAGCGRGAVGCGRGAVGLRERCRGRRHLPDLLIRRDHVHVIFSCPISMYNCRHAA